jgi:hypothetical protein
MLSSWNNEYVCWSVSVIIIIRWRFSWSSWGGHKEPGSITAYGFTAGKILCIHINIYTHTTNCYYSIGINTRRVRLSYPVGITRYKTRFGCIVRTINCVEEDRLGSMKHSRWLDWWRDWIRDGGFTWSRIWDIF